MAGEQIIGAVIPGQAAPDTGQEAGQEAGDARLSQAFALPEPGVQTGYGGSAGERAASARVGDWVAPIVAGLFCVAWTGFFVSAHWSQMAVAADPAMWAGWASAWAAPALLIAVLWLIAGQSRRREIDRLMSGSRLFAGESERLEARLVTINRELSVAREFVTAQARDLDAVGRIAVDRLSQHAQQLQSLVQDNRAQVETIGTVSVAALDNMERLRGQLPVLTSAAKDVTNHFGQAGRVAGAQLDDLIAGFDRLAEASQDTEKRIGSCRSQFDRTVDSFAARGVEMDHAIAARAAAMAAQADQFHQAVNAQQADFDTRLRVRAAALASEIAESRGRLDREESESITSLRARLMALREESSTIARALSDAESVALSHWREATTRLDQEMRSAGDMAAEIGRQSAAASNTRMSRLAEEATALERVLSETGARAEAETARRRHAGEAQDHGMLERLSAQLAAIDAQIARRQSAHTAHLAALASRGEAATTQLAAIEEQIAGIAAASGATEIGMTRSLDLLGQRLSAGRKLLEETGHTLAGVTSRSMALLDLIQNAATQARDDLGQAIGTGAARFGELEEHALTLREVVIDADHSGASLAGHLLQTQTRLGEATAAMAVLHDDIHARSQAHGVQLDGLTRSVTRLDEKTIAAAARVQGELLAAIGELEIAATGAVAQIENRGAASVSALARQLGADSGAAIERAMRVQVAEISGKLEQAAAHAAGISREAAGQLRDQLAKVDGLVAQLETRVDHARARAEERVDDDFARRVALITEALNSHAIDIAKALDTDVGDPAWSAYLRGDRGIFTRRAVRLLDPPEARGILQLYQTDRAFREHVSHYIHDFEAMLRQLLSTRDGHALGVTVLSSDMGKLYVALAQAIERLRS